MTAKLSVAPAIPTFPPQDFLNGTEPCTKTDPDLFFPPAGTPSREARRICDGCYVREECLGWALDARIEYGVWGGVAMGSLTRDGHREAQRRYKERKRAGAAA